MAGGDRNGAVPESDGGQKRRSMGFGKSRPTGEVGLGSGEWPSRRPSLNASLGGSARRREEGHRQMSRRVTAACIGAAGEARGRSNRARAEADGAKNREIAQVIRDRPGGWKSQNAMSSRISCRGQAGGTPGRQRLRTSDSRRKLRETVTGKRTECAGRAAIDGGGL